MYFSLQEYETRLAKTRQAMDAQGVELLFITVPSNMSWLTGYDGWSFYVHQGLLVFPDEPPIWWGPEMDVNGGKHGLKKDSRCGYPIGISYPPDWGERTMSLRSGDTTVLEPNMTFHFMPGLWFEDWGIEITESIAITEDEPECLASVPRELFVKG